MEFAWVKDAMNSFGAFAVGDDPTEASGGCAEFSGGDGGGIGAFFAWAIMPGQGGEAGGGFFVSQGRGIEKLEAAEGVGAVDQDQSVFACVLSSGIDGPIEFLNLACGEIRLILACGEGDERVIDDKSAHTRESSRRCDVACPDVPRSPHGQRRRGRSTDRLCCCLLA